MLSENLNNLKSFLNNLRPSVISARREDKICTIFLRLDKTGTPVFQKVIDDEKLKIARKIKTSHKLVALMNGARTQDKRTNFAMMNEKGQKYVYTRLNKEDSLSLFEPINADGYTALRYTCPDVQKMFIDSLQDSEMICFFLKGLSQRQYNEFIFLTQSVQEAALAKIDNPAHLKHFLLMPATAHGRSVFQFLPKELKIKQALRMKRAADVRDLYKNSRNDVILDEVIHAPKEMRQPLLERFPTLLDKPERMVKKVTSHTQKTHADNDRQRQ